MRMWNVDPKFMCNKHRLGEHVEMHMFVGCVKKSKSLDGYVYGGLVELHKLRARHDLLVLEMEGRGMRHNSPLDWEDCCEVIGKVDGERSLKELRERCEECREKYGKSI